MAGTTIKIYKGIPWDSSYKFLKTFADATAQATFINGFLYREFSDCSYVRTGGEFKVRLEISQSALDGCNYLSFVNVGYSTRIYYAFITKAEYIADGTTFVSFKVDYWQTYQFQIVFENCYIEREHVDNDQTGKHTIPEGLETGPTRIDSSTLLNFKDEYGVSQRCIVLSSTDASGGIVCGKSNNVLQGCLQFVTEITNANGLQMWLDGFAESGLMDNIISVYQAPAFCTSSDQQFQQMVAKTVTLPSRPSTLDGYTPKNKKLLCYPFCFATVSNNSGSVIELMFDYWGSDGVRKAKVYGVSAPVPQCQFVPLDYQKVTENYNYSLTFDNFPSVAVGTDAFKIWWGQNKNQSVASGVSNIADVVAGAATGGIGGALSAIGQGIIGTVGKIGDFIKGNEFVSSVIGEKAAEKVGSSLESVSEKVSQTVFFKNTPSSVVGNLTTEGLLAGQDRQGFQVYYHTLRSEYAKMIDDYFTVYGYKVNRVGALKINSRTGWNFVKTNGANVHGNIPLECKELMEQLLNSGVWFWHNANVGDFSKDNSIK